MKHKKKLTPICVLHYVKLAYRSLLLLIAGAMYIVHHVEHTAHTFGGYEDDHVVLGAICLVFAIEMAFRFFPSRFESMGCGKQFGRNFRPTGEVEATLPSWKRTFAVVMAWLALNGAIALLYLLGIIDRGALILISLTYSVCDMICILFFCPFQTWFLKNRCCTVCRIYNWDFAMMFTPLILIPNAYAYSLVAMSIALLLRWEITLRRHPERFSERTNACLDCRDCDEKLCHHKKQLRSFWEKERSRIFPKR